MMRIIRPLPPVCRALLAVEHDWPALRKVIGEYTEFEAEPPMPGLGLPERQRSALWAYMRECEAVAVETPRASLRATYGHHALLDRLPLRPDFSERKWSEEELDADAQRYEDSL